MPKKQTIARAREDKREGKSPSTQAGARSARRRAGKKVSPRRVRATRRALKREGRRAVARKATRTRARRAA